MKKGKVSIIGSGFVGSTTAYTLALSGLLYEIVIVDVNKEKAEGDAMDISHGSSFLTPVNVVQGDYADTAGSDIVVITAGVSQKPGETRIDLLKRNTSVFKSILDGLIPYCDDHTILLVVTNPVDILTYITRKLSGFDPKRVIGSGTVLDTARLKYMIGEHAGVDARDVQAFIMGEHGDSELAVWSHTYITGIPMDDFCEICGRCAEGRRICKEEIFDGVKNAAYRIIEKKGATYYAVALCVQRIVEAILGDEHSILTVSSLFDGQYGIEGCCISAPSIMGANGLERVLEVKLNSEEYEQFHQSADVLKGLIAELGI